MDQGTVLQQVSRDRSATASVWSGGCGSSGLDAGLANHAVTWLRPPAD